MNNITRNDAWAHISNTNSGVCILNNTWGLSPEELALAPHVLWHDPVTNRMGWQAAIPDELYDPSKVRSFQQAYQGQKDRNLPTAGNYDWQGKPVGALTSLVTSFGLTLMSSTDMLPKANSTMEIFLHEGPEAIISGGDDDSRRFEIMLWLQQPAPEISLGAPSFQHEQANVYMRTDGAFPYVAFVLNEGVESISVDWIHLINVLRPRFPAVNFDTLNIHAVEAGTEVWGGTISAELLMLETEASFVASNPSLPTHPKPVTGSGEGQPLSALSTLLYLHTDILRHKADMSRELGHQINAIVEFNDPFLSAALPELWDKFLNTSEISTVEQTLRQRIKVELELELGTNSRQTGSET